MRCRYRLYERASSVPISCRDMLSSGISTGSWLLHGSRISGLSSIEDRMFRRMQSTRLYSNILQMTFLDSPSSPLVHESRHHVGYYLRDTAHTRTHAHTRSKYADNRTSHRDQYLRGEQSSPSHRNRSVSFISANCQSREISLSTWKSLLCTKKRIWLTKSKFC